MRLVVRVDRSDGLPCSMKLTDLGKPPVASIEYLLDYPETGPIDISSLGVPRTAPIDDKVPGNQLRRVLAGNQAGRNGFDDYQALVDDGNLYRISRKGVKWRLEFGQPQDCPWNNPPPQFSNEYWREYAERVTFLPLALSNGKAIYRARISEPNGHGLQELEGWELQRKVRPKEGVSVLAKYGYDWALPEFYTYPDVEMLGYPVAAADPRDGPEGMVFFAVRKNKYWSDPSKDYAMAKFQTVSDPDPQGIAQEITTTNELVDFEENAAWYVVPTTGQTHHGRLQGRARSANRDGEDAAVSDRLQSGTARTTVRAQLRMFCRRIVGDAQRQEDGRHPERRRSAARCTGRDGARPSR